MARLRYSDRVREAAEGTLGPLSYDTVSEKFRAALVSMYEFAARRRPVGSHFDDRMRAASEQHFGRKFYGVNASGGTLQRFVMDSSTSVADLLDFVEILADEALREWTFQEEGRSITRAADMEIQDRVNAAFARHRLGYRVSSGQVVRVGSPALDEAFVGPALLATTRPGWEQVDRSYRDALSHRRGGADERGAAITDAHAALEAAMKAAGLKGDTLAALAKSFRNSGLVLPQLEGVPDLLDKLLKRSQSVRDSLSDAHGRDPGTEEVPAEVVDLAIHWAGAFILYLADATS